MEYTQYLNVIFGLIIAFCVTFVKIPKIELNIWSWMFTSIGKCLNGELIVKINSIAKEVDTIKENLDSHIAKDQKNQLRDCRQRILRFNDEILSNIEHSHEHYNQVLEDINDYENYCNTHPEYENNKAILAIENIKDRYKMHMQDNSFLK